MLHLYHQLMIHNKCACCFQAVIEEPHLQGSTRQKTRWHCALSSLRAHEQLLPRSLWPSWSQRSTYSSVNQPTHDHFRWGVVSSNSRGPLIEINGHSFQFALNIDFDCWHFIHAMIRLYRLRLLWDCIGPTLHTDLYCENWRYLPLSVDGNSRYRHPESGRWSLIMHRRWLIANPLLPDFNFLHITPMQFQSKNHFQGNHWSIHAIVARSAQPKCTRWHGYILFGRRKVARVIHN